MATTTNYGWTTPDDTDLVKDGAAAIRTLGSSVDTTTKNLNPQTTTGALAYRSATANINTALPIGSTGQVLTVAGGVPTWAAPAGGGKVLQVVYGSTTTVTSISTSAFADTSLSASITPSAASSKVLILVSQQAVNSRSGNDIGYTYKLLRASTDIFVMGANAYYLAASAAAGTLMQAGVFSLNYLDSPNTTSATTYKTQGKAYLGNVTFQDSGAGGSNISTMILLEIGA